MDANGTLAVVGPRYISVRKIIALKYRNRGKGEGIKKVSIYFVDDLNTKNLEKITGKPKVKHEILILLCNYDNYS